MRHFHRTSVFTVMFYASTALAQPVPAGDEGAAVLTDPDEIAADAFVRELRSSRSDTKPLLNVDQKELFAENSEKVFAALEAEGCELSRDMTTEIEGRELRLKELLAADEEHDPEVQELKTQLMELRVVAILECCRKASLTC